MPLSNGSISKLLQQFLLLVASGGWVGLVALGGRGIIHRVQLAGCPVALLLLLLLLLLLSV
jgi:hypothetical protein